MTKKATRTTAARAGHEALTLGEGRLRMKRIFAVLAVMAAMMVASAGTASAQATFITTPCLFIEEAERDNTEYVTLLQLPTPSGEARDQCIGKPWEPSY